MSKAPKMTSEELRKIRDVLAEEQLRKPTASEAYQRYEQQSKVYVKQYAYDMLRRKSTGKAGKPYRVRPSLMATSGSSAGEVIPCTTLQTVGRGKSCRTTWSEVDGELLWKQGPDNFRAQFGVSH